MWYLQAYLLRHELLPQCHLVTSSAVSKTEIIQPDLHAKNFQHSLVEGSLVLLDVLHPGRLCCTRKQLGLFVGKPNSK